MKEEPEVYPDASYETDIPREEAIKRATKLIQNGFLVFIKWNCGKCGHRQVWEPNAIYEYGICEKCGATTKVDRVGFTIMGLVEDLGKLLGGEA